MRDRPRLIGQAPQPRNDLWRAESSNSDGVGTTSVFVRIVPAGVILSCWYSDTERMNARGNPKTLRALQPGNRNAVKHGVHSARLIQTRAAEIADELAQSHSFTPAERIAVNEAARCVAVLEAIDRDLDQRGLVDKEGAPRYLLNHRSRTSRQLENWLERVSAAIERTSARELPPVRGDFPDYVLALQEIALGRDATATARDRLAAMKELLELGTKGQTSYLERPAQPELRQRALAVREAREVRELERSEREVGLAD